MSNILQQLHPLLQDAVERLAVKLQRCGITDRARIDKLVSTSPKICTALTALGHKGATVCVQRNLIAAAVIELQSKNPTAGDPLVLDEPYFTLINVAARQMLCSRDNKAALEETTRQLYRDLYERAMAQTGCSAEASSVAISGCALLQPTMDELLDGPKATEDATVH